MNIRKINENGVSIAYVTSDEKLITDVQSAIDLMATVRYEADCRRIIVNKSAGFVQIGRSEFDGSGNPFPLLHLEIS
ncbi:DUF4180 domain-containing protein [Paenibacillus sp. 2KB_22]|uniref:DUF4180 domain-containing protein n=1 Tax=Paenibacillus sp. 2KB_22 TaxID=3232978 RepID=UPI003F9D55EB